MSIISRLCISGYRSLRDVRLEIGQLTVVTGANGSGKSSLYRALRLLADVAQGRIIQSLALEGGLQSVLWAGPEQFSRAMKAGTQAVQGTVRKNSVSLKLGFLPATTASPSISACRCLTPGTSARIPSSRPRASGPGWSCGRANTLRPAQGAGGQPAQPGRRVAVGLRQARVLRQHAHALQRPARRCRAAVAAREHARLALLRPLPHRQRGAGAASPDRHADAGAGLRRRRPGGGHRARSRKSAPRTSSRRRLPTPFPGWLDRCRGCRRLFRGRDAPARAAAAAQGLRAFGRHACATCCWSRPCCRRGRRR